MKTNSLVYKTTLHTKEETFIIKISLNDECKNGHQDFSITGTIYEKGKALIDKNMVSGGAIGDKIALNFPKFAIFNRLHLCDYKGIPMHCSANGFYHLKNGFNSKSTGEEFKNEYCEYYRITPAQFEELKNSENEIQFALKLENLGIFEQWENEANKAIKLLENLTGDEFIVDSTKTNYYKPKTEAIMEEIERQKNGYYSPEKKQEREQAKVDANFKKLEYERQKSINAINEEYKVKKAVLTIGGAKGLDNAIYYNHTKTVALNWRKYGNELTPEEVDNIIKNIVLPEGVRIELSKNK